jgi:hypothetical protein
MKLTCPKTSDAIARSATAMMVVRPPTSVIAVAGAEPHMVPATVEIAAILMAECIVVKILEPALSEVVNLRRGHTTHTRGSKKKRRVARTSYLERHAKTDNVC